MMRKIERGDVKDILEYEKDRSNFRRHIIDMKKGRRIDVGRYLGFVFENRDTVLFQIEEMIRAERIVQEERIAEEIAVYNALIPGSDELSATMLIQITEPKRIKPVLESFIGVDSGECVWLAFGEERVYGRFEEGHSNESRISAVHYVTFPFTEQQARHFRSGEDVLFLCVEHGDYQHQALVKPEVRHSLIQDLEALDDPMRGRST
jgi:hypothetical protein